MPDKKRQRPSKDKRRGAEPDDIVSERGQSPDASEEDEAEIDVLDDQDHTVVKDDRRERRRDRHE